MKVKELISKLEKIEDKDAIVTFAVSDDCFMPISPSIKKQYCIHQGSEKGEMIVILK